MDASGKKKYIVQLLPSYEMNIESWQPEPEGGSSPTPPPWWHEPQAQWKNLSSVDNLIFTSYEGNNCFIIPKLLLTCLKLECVVF